jgi:hypothetical protein
MMTIAEWLSPTRASGLVAYGAAVACCAFTWIKARGGGRPWQLPAVLTVIEVGLLLDIAFNWRWMLHSLLANLAQSENEYGTRRLPQLIVLILLGGLLFLVLRTAKRSYQNRLGALLAVAGVVLSFALWCIEVVSLHAADHVLYHSLGPFMTISFLWIPACLMTSIGMLLHSRQATASVAFRN